MIDPHVHLRDGKQQHKETLLHGLRVAEKIGLAAVFDMPNTAPPILHRSDVLRRLSIARAAGSSVFYGLYCGLTSDSTQITEAVECVREFQQVVGLKLFAGKSTGNLSIPDTVSQRRVFQTLTEHDYRGVLAIHCEDEADFRPTDWDPQRPITHTMVRPPIAEIHSITKMIKLARETRFKGTLHVCHISLPESVEIIEAARMDIAFQITCGATSHHLLLWDTTMENADGLLLKMNPPLRSKSNQIALMQMLLDGRIDWIETDHAPHLKKEKLEPPYASGIPGFPILPDLLRILREKGASDSLISRITHDRVCEIFGLAIPNREIQDIDVFNEYEVNAYSDWIKKRKQTE